MILPFTNHKKLKLQIVCQQGRTEGFQTGEKKVAAYMNYHEIRQIVDIAKTIMARVYKGPIKILEVQNERRKDEESD